MNSLSKNILDYLMIYVGPNHINFRGCTFRIFRFKNIASMQCLKCGFISSYRGVEYLYINNQITRTLYGYFYD